jgi:hypothetical protein
MRPKEAKDPVCYPGPVHFEPRCLKRKPSRKDGCLKTKNLAKTIVVPLERGANEVRDEIQTGDF